MLKAVFFDAAGTLFEAVEPAGHTYARIARKHSLEADDAVISARFRQAFFSAPALAFGPGHAPPELRAMERRWWSELVRKTFVGLGAFDNFDNFFDELFAYFAEPSHWRAVPEAHAVLQELRRRGFRLGVISNFDYRLYRILDRLGLAAYFDSVTISSEAGFAKPAREIFMRALEAMELGPAEAVHVGDSEHTDFAGALAAGIAAVLIDPHLSGAEMLDGRRARIGSLESLVKTVRRLQPA